MRRPLLILYPWTFFSPPAEREVKEVVEMANHVRGSSSIEGKNAVDRTDERRHGATGTATAFSPITPAVTKSANTMMSQSGPSDYIARSCLGSFNAEQSSPSPTRQTDFSTSAANSTLGMANIERAGGEKTFVCSATNQREEGRKKGAK